MKSSAMFLTFSTTAILNGWYRDTTASSTNLFVSYDNKKAGNLRGRTKATKSCIRLCNAPDLRSRQKKLCLNVCEEELEILVSHKPTKPSKPNNSFNKTDLCIDECKDSDLHPRKECIAECWKATMNGDPGDNSPVVDQGPPKKTISDIDIKMVPDTTTPSTASEAGGDDIWLSGDGRWYVDYSIGAEGQCVKSCDMGSFCGGVRDNWVTGYSTASECCQKKLWWMKGSQCVPHHISEP